MLGDSRLGFVRFVVVGILIVATSACILANGPIIAVGLMNGHRGCYKSLMSVLLLPTPGEHEMED